MKERRAAFAAAMSAQAPAGRPQGSPPAAAPSERGGRALIGIPAALGIYGQLPLWKCFFTELGVPFVTSERFEAGITAGREVQGAEFCAPLAALHGHVKYLSDKADWIFLPVLLEESRPGTSTPRVYCYYTQFSSALASGIAEAGLRERCLMPQASWTRWRDRTKRELHQALVKAGMTHLGEAQVSLAFEKATAAYDTGVRLLQERFIAETAIGRRAGRRPPGPSVQRALSGNEQGHQRYLWLARGEDLFPGHGALWSGRRGKHRPPPGHGPLALRGEDPRGGMRGG